MVKHESKAILNFIPNNLGRIKLELLIQKANKINMSNIDFDLDTGSDFTTIDIIYLIKLGYTKDFLKKCPYYKNPASTVAKEHNINLQYIDNTTILLDCIELKNQRLYFSMNKTMRNLLYQYPIKKLIKNQVKTLIYGFYADFFQYFYWILVLGSDLLKYFNMKINRDTSIVNLTLTKEISKQVEHGKKSDICYLTK